RRLGERQELPHPQHPPARSGKPDLYLHRLPVALALGDWRTSLRSWDKIPILSWLNPSKYKMTRLESCPTREILGRRSPWFLRTPPGMCHRAPWGLNGGGRSGIVGWWLSGGRARLEGRHVVGVEQ